MTYLKKEFDALCNYWQDEDPALQVVRKNAFNQFNELGFPTKKWEEWQFTDFSDLKKSVFHLSYANDLPDLPEVIPGRIQNTHLIFMINGHYQPQLSELPSGVTISTGLDHFNANPDDYQLNGNPFSALNTSMMNSGISLAIEPNSIIEKPIQVIYLMWNFSEPLMNHPRLDFKIGANSQAEIIEHFLGTEPMSHFVNSVSKIKIDQNAKLIHTRILEAHDTGNYMASTHYSLGQDAGLKTTTLSSGARLFRHNIQLTFKGPGAKANLNGLSLAENNQHHDQHVVIDHETDACDSHQLFKYILRDTSSGVFNGRVIVRENTKQTDANQSNKNLLLSPMALMNANPQLEIYSEDVKCSHGSTTGQIDPEALFYIRSRGINKRKAMKLMIGGFAKEIIESVDNQDVKSYFDTCVANWLEGATGDG